MIANRFLITQISYVLFVIIITGHQVAGISNMTQRNKELFEATSEFIPIWRWNEVILITDNKDVKTPFLYLSDILTKTTVLPFHNVITNVVARTVMPRSAKIIVWCQLDSLKTLLDLAFLQGFLNKSFFWLILLHDNTDFESLLPLSSGFLREDSNLFALFPSAQSEENQIYHLVRIIYHQFPKRHVRYFPLARYRKSTGATKLPVGDMFTGRLHDYRLTVGVIDYPPLMTLSTNSDGNVSVTGLVPDVILALSKVLGFSYSFVKAPSNTFGSLTDGVWNGIIGLVNTKEVNVGGAIAIHPRRLQVLDFSSDVVRTKIVIALRNPSVFAKTTYRCTIYLKPFPMSIWKLSALTWFVLVAVWQILAFSYSKGKLPTRYRRHRHPHIMKIVVFRILQVLDVLVTFCFTPKIAAARTFSSKIVVLLTLGFILFITYSYTSVLISTKSVARNNLPFKSLNDIIQAGYNFGVLKSSLPQSIIETNKHQDYYALAWKTISSNPSNFFLESRLGIKRVCSEQFAYVDSALGVSSVSDPPCCFEMLKNRAVTYMNLPFPKGSPLVETFSAKILQLRATGVLSRLRLKYISSLPPRCPATAKMIVNIGEAVGAFIVLGSGILLSLLVLFCEIVSSNVYR